MMYKLLLVDDEFWVIEQLTRILQKASPDIKCWTICGSAINGKDALKKIIDLAPDIVIMDIQMSELNGIEVLNQIAGLSVRPEVIFLSGYNKFEYVQTAMNRGAAGYILKPLVPDEIFSILIKTIQKIEEKKKIANWHYVDMDLSKSPESVSGAPEEFLSKIEKMFYRSDYTELKNILAELKKEYPDALIPNKNSYYNAYKYVVFVFEILNKYKINQLDGKGPLDYYASIDAALTNSDIFFSLRQLLLKAMSERIYLIRESTNAPSFLVDSLTEYMNAHFTENLTLDYLGEVFHFHPVYLSSIFKKYKNLSISQYLTEIRIQKAKEFLHQGKKPSEVAHLVGYHSGKYFSDAFKKKTGCTPSEYRKLHCLPPYSESSH